MLPARLASCDGTLTLTLGKVCWEPKAATSAMRVQQWLLADVTATDVRQVQLNVFTRVTRLTVKLRGATSELEFDVATSITLARSFATELQHAAAAAAATAAPAVAPSADATSPAIRLTARVQAGRALRKELQRINQLQGKGRADDAAAAMAALDASAPSTAKARDAEANLAKQRVRELRGELFSYGEASLTREVLRRFLQIPEVRLLLPQELQKRQRDSAEAETRRLLLDTAKEFIATIYKIRGGGVHGRGRRTDVARNAMAAGLAQLLPRSLFESRHGRAACRILGISYRQAKRGVQLNGESLDAGGWKQVTTVQHFDNASGAIARALDEFWHSEAASEPDNMNKQNVRVDLGVDPKTGVRLYALHSRRAQKASARLLHPVFRRSAIAGRLREETRVERVVRKKRKGGERVVRKGRDGVKVGWRQFREGKCSCIKKRKPAECVCLKCSYLISNIARLHSARRAWHRSAIERPGGKPCVCHIHPPAGAAEAAARHAAACRSIEDARQSVEEAERAAMEGGGDGAAARWEAALAERDAAVAAHVVAEAEAAEAARKEAKARKYDNMFSSVDTLTETLMPCGKEGHPELSIIGASEYQTFKRRCISNDCENRIWRAREACGFEGVFGAPCPTEANGERTEWRRWEKRLRGVNKDGEEFHSLEWVPADGSRKQLWDELLPAIKDTLPHIWREDLMSQSVRVYDDRKSGRHLEQLLKRRRLVTMPQLMSTALDVVVLWAEAVIRDLPLLPHPPFLLSAEQREQQGDMLGLPVLRAVLRLACAAEMPPAATVEEATQAAAVAQQVFDSLATAATIQSDYASQLETSREFHATCATKERHNYLVTLIGYRSRQEPRARPRKMQPRRRRVVQEKPYERPARRIEVPADPGRLPSSRYPVEHDSRQTVDFKQNVDGLFAFHKV